MILMIDNYDSFTYNLVQYLGELGQELIIKRNDEITIDEITRLAPSYIVISPGPCTPDEAGISMEVIQTFKGLIPILGVCLGHQAIAQSFEGKVIRAKTPVHGKTSPVNHNGETLYMNIPNPMTVTRYHSLIVDSDCVPDCLEVTATLDSGEIMGMRHKDYPIEGVQYHPESIMTTHGKTLLKNFIEYYK